MAKLKVAGQSANQNEGGIRCSTGCADLKSLCQKEKKTVKAIKNLKKNKVFL